MASRVEFTLNIGTLHPGLCVHTMSIISILCFFKKELRIGNIIHECYYLLISLESLLCE